MTSATKQTSAAHAEFDAADHFSPKEDAFMRAYYDVSDEVLIARMLAAPDMGGSMLVQLSEFIAEQKSEHLEEEPAAVPRMKAPVLTFRDLRARGLTPETLERLRNSDPLQY